MVELFCIRAKQSATHVYNKKEKAAAICRRPGVNLLLTLYRKDRKLSSIIVHLYMASLFHLLSSRTNGLQYIFTAAFSNFHFLHFLKLSKEIQPIGSICGRDLHDCKYTNRNYITNGNRGRVVCERKLHTIDGTYLWMKAKIAA